MNGMSIKLNNEWNVNKLYNEWNVNQA